MAYGLPCVVTDVGPTREFLAETAGGPTVRLAAPAAPPALAAAVTALVPDRAGRERLGAAGRAFARDRFDPRTFARRHAELLGLPTHG